MKIGITCYPTYGGSGIIATELGKSLAKRGHEVHFITYSVPARLSHFTERIFYHEVEDVQYPLFEHSPYALSLAAKMAEVIEYHRLDLLHVHYAIPHSISAFLAKQIINRKDLKVITTLHGTDISLVGNQPSLLPITRYSIEVSDAVTAVSNHLRDATRRELNITREISVIHNFVDMDIFKRGGGDAIRRTFAPNGEKIISNISNFRPVKRLDMVVRVFKEIRQRIRSKLVLVGDGPERAKVEKTCRELGICSDIIFLGKQDMIAEILSASDLFLFLSETESFGLAVLEAMACGTPVVTTAVGGLPEVFSDGKEGFMTGKDDFSAVVEKSIVLLSDDRLWSKMSAHAESTAREKFNIEKITAEYEEFYRRVKAD